MKKIMYAKHLAKYYLSGFCVKLMGLDRKRNHYLKSIKDKYKGQRCFILGNGPSLTKEDLECLKNEITFASNRIYKMFSETDWRPTYYAIFDESVAASEGVIAGANSFECQMKFYRQEGYYIYRKMQEPACFLHSWWNRKYLYAPKFSQDITKGVYTIATVTYTLMQIARYMGFTEIYLIGVDHKYAQERTKDGRIINNATRSYFGKENYNEKKTVAATWEMEAAYNYAEKISRENGFRIFNATRGGNLEVFERKTLEQMISLNEEKE